MFLKVLSNPNHDSMGLRFHDLILHYSFASKLVEKLQKQKKPLPQEL